MRNGLWRGTNLRKVFDPPHASAAATGEYSLYSFVYSYAGTANISGCAWNVPFDILYQRHSRYEERCICISASRVWAWRSGCLNLSAVLLL